MKTTPTFLVAMLVAVMALCTTAKAQTLLAGFEDSLNGFVVSPEEPTFTADTGPTGATEGTSALQFTTTTGGFQFVTSFGLFAALTNPENETLSFDVLFTPDDPTGVTFAQVDFGINSNGTVLAEDNFQFTSETLGIDQVPITPGVPATVEISFSDLPEFPLTNPELNFAGLLLIVNTDAGVEAAGTWSFDNVVVTTSADTEVLLGDVDLNGEVNFFDINPFILILSAQGFQAEADCDESGEVNFFDISPFIDILAAAGGAG